MYNCTDGGVIFTNNVVIQTVYNQDNENEAIRSSPVIKQMRVNTIYEQ